MFHFMKHLILQLCLFTAVVVVRSPAYVICIKKRNYIGTNILKIFKTELKMHEKISKSVHIHFLQATQSIQSPAKWKMFTLSFGDSRHTQIMPIRVTISFVTIVCKIVTSKIQKKNIFSKIPQKQISNFSTQKFLTTFSHIFT